ncbi:hypothetical protein CERSUDRAFT_114274 [Gelatoporia subvermispora B]|uniref:Uncharacterized protein n=1 Tax=Ceriporiopsis subvermispora (strain B) TaxID=914234 RepID=M2QZJ0_CERS8|nr:hypothetical protein CERSUDRAFT_114274 [Gelatoporia subvermispora B]
MMARPHDQRPDGGVPSLEDRVTDIVQRAFWDEALETLSNPEPSVQLPRLKRLYGDLHIALQQLLPADHMVLLTLSSPLSPTSSPLRSAITHVREILIALRERCAPARDAQINGLLHSLDDIPPASITASASTPVLAELVVDTIRNILHLTDIMKDDLSEFVLGAMGETQLRGLVRTQARAREREVILQLWPASRIQDEWRNWLIRSPPPSTVALGGEERVPWVRCLVWALGSTTPVSCITPSTANSGPATRTDATGDTTSESDNAVSMASNYLPPCFLFICPTLLYLQNYLQALVITASLRSLVRLPLPGNISASSNPHLDFTHRVWVLLKAEVDGTPESGDTKLINLADEVIRVRQSYGGTSDKEEEQRLRAAVDRTLHPTDPVFALLRRRLITSVVNHVADSYGKVNAQVAPERMQSGRPATPERSGKKPRLMVIMDEGASGEKSSLHEAPLKIKGFEDPVLIEALNGALTKLKECMEWLHEQWPDLTEQDIIADVQHTEGSIGIPGWT